MSATLFVTWDGPAQNYMQALFFPTFARAQRDDLRIDVLQFTWADEDFVKKTAQSARAHNLSYTHAPTLRRPRQLAVPAMIVIGARRILAQVRAQKIDTLMPRSIIPAAMCLLVRRWRPDIKLVYDADGFMADERVDFAGWNPQGAMYRLFRDWEAQAVRSAEAVITRSTHARDILRARAGAGAPRDHIHVLPNAKDESIFTPISDESRAHVRAQHGIPQDAPLLVYAGSLGPQYHPDKMVELFDLVGQQSPPEKQPHLLVMSGMAEVMRDVLKAYPQSLRDRVTITRCAPEEVAQYIAAGDLGLSLRQPSFSQQGVCPIKVVEYVLCGTPTVMLKGVGDLDERFEGSQGLYSLQDTSTTQLQACATWFTTHALSQRKAWSASLREVGISQFGLHAASEHLHNILTTR